MSCQAAPPSVEEDQFHAARTFHVTVREAPTGQTSPAEGAPNSTAAEAYLRSALVLVVVADALVALRIQA